MFDKDKYRENRDKGIRGQGATPVPIASADSIPDGAKVSFGNDGTMVVKNRAYRRQSVRMSKKSSQLRKKNKRK
jgi:hypothetical protein